MSESPVTNGGPRPNAIIDIVTQGDVILDIRHDSTATTTHKFRVDSSVLKSSSKYFSSLLQGRFGEAERIEKEHSLLKERYGRLADVPVQELPTVTIQDIGRISTIKSIEPLCKDFFHILHDHDLQTTLPLANLANLAVVADRFDALEKVRGYIRRKKLIRAIEGKTTAKTEAALTEEKMRQRLLVGMELDYPMWVERYSARLIVKGWAGSEHNEMAALWWDLPMRVEDELAFRRECILDTLQALQMHFVSLYTSRDRQCKLGYDSSTQCDSFQLGELIRFFTRAGTLQVQGTILDNTEPPLPYAGDIHTLIDSLRQAPEYQIDRFHTHCGIRTRLTPLLDMLGAALAFVGICPDCASENRSEHYWLDGKRPLLWKKQAFRLRGLEHKALHAQVRALFTASHRDWTS